jgi:Cep192 domain 4
MPSSARRLSLPFFILLAALGLLSCGGGSSTPSAPAATHPAVQLSETSLTFWGQVQGSTSPAQTVTLTNSGNGPLGITSVAVSGDFAVSSTCGTTVAASASCSINVTFSPTSGGAATGFVTLADNAASSPQSIALSGTGMAGLVKLSTDKFTNLTSQHATEVEPNVWANGLTMVSAFQVGRFYDGGSSGAGFATSTDGGVTWTRGILPGITNLDPSNPAGIYDRVSDLVVAYDAKHAEWLVVTLPILNAGVVAPNLLVSRSKNGLTWDNPPVTVTVDGDYDKPWLTCDNWPASPFYGNCYMEWDEPPDDSVQMSTSSDGGLTWEPAADISSANGGIGGQPVVEPKGNVVVPIADGFESNILSFMSSDGGATWTSPVTVSPIMDHNLGPPSYTEAGGLRYGPLPSAVVDSSGKIYVVWPDCSFRINCTSNDIVMSTSMDGTTWSPVTRIPIDPVTSGTDHFIPGITVDPATSGGTAHLGLVYYYYPTAACTAATCELDVGFISSPDGGANWTNPTQLAGPMSVTSLPATDIGYMVADYISASYVNGLAFGAFAVANPNAGATYDQAIYANANGLSAQARAHLRSSRGEAAIRHARSNHPVRRTPARVR